MESKRQKLDLEKVNETNSDVFNINDFPNEVIEKIFSFFTQNQLSQISRVCKRWNALTKSPVLWKKVNVRFFFSSDKERDAQSLKAFIDGLPSCVTFIRLALTGRILHYIDLDFENVCMKLQNSCPNLEVLILTCCDISTILPEVINFCTQFLQSLKKLVLNDCLFRDNSGTEKLEDNSTIEVLDLFSSYFSYYRKIQFSKLLSLKELRLAETDVNDKWLVRGTSFFNQLHVLDLRRTDVTSRTFLAIQVHGQNLKELYLCDIELEDNDLRFNNPHLNFNNPVFPRLQTVCLRRTSVTREGLVSLVRSSPSLVNVYVDERVARYFSEHSFVVANRCKSGIVKSIDDDHNHSVDYSHN